MKYDIFISYSRKDSEIVESFCSNFVQAGYSVWIDRAGIESGATFKATIVQAIKDSRVIIFFSSNASNNSAWTAKEIAIAVENRKTIIPIRLDSTGYSDEVMFDMINKDYIDYSEPHLRASSMERLLANLSSILANNSNLESRPDVTRFINSSKKSRNKRLTTLSLVFTSILIIISIAFGAIIQHDRKKTGYVSHKGDVTPENVRGGVYEVDLGLSVIWASCNVGGNNPEDFGRYFAWGEIEDKSTYDWENYRLGSESVQTKYYPPKDGKYRLETSDDAANVIQKEGWRIPIDEEVVELIKLCKWEWTRINGVKGFSIEGPNGNSIFLPASGYREGNDFYSAGEYGSYWTSSLDEGYTCEAYSLDFFDRNAFLYFSDRCKGFVIRAVKNKDI